MATSPHPVLSKEDGPLGVDLHQCGDEEHDWRCQYQSDARANHIHEAFDEQLPAPQRRRRQLDQRLVAAPHQLGLDPRDLEAARHRQHLTPGRQRGIHDVVKPRITQIPAHDNRLGARVVQHRGEIHDVPERLGRRRNVGVHEPDGPILRIGSKRGTPRRLPARLPRTDEQRAQRVVRHRLEATDH